MVDIRTPLTPSGLSRTLSSPSSMYCLRWITIVNRLLVRFVSAKAPERETKTLARR